MDGGAAVLGIQPRQRGLDAEQARAAAAVAGTDPLVVVEGATGAGKTMMLGAAIETAADQGRPTRIVTPTKKAADTAAQELGVNTDNVAKLVHEHGWWWNRDGVWTVQAVGDDRTVWATGNGNGRRRERTVRLPADDLAERTHLAYASTAYGVQGATVPGSHTVLSDALDAAGVYVVTRGQETNRFHIVAEGLDDVREQFAVAFERDRADRGLAAATQAVREAVAGLAADGPVRLVNAERARLTEQIERAERQAEKWEQVLTALDRQRAAQRAESDQQEEVVVAADARTVQVRAEVAAP
ncbi:MAG: AAA family ATPase [Microbacterium sp.]